MDEQMLWRKVDEYAREHDALIQAMKLAAEAQAVHRRALEAMMGPYRVISTNNTNLESWKKLVGG